MRRVEHRIKLASISHASLHCGQEYLRRVTEHDYAQRDGK